MFELTVHSYFLALFECILNIFIQIMGLNLETLFNNIIKNYELFLIQIEL